MLLLVGFTVVAVLVDGVDGLLAVRDADVDEVEGVDDRCLLILIVLAVVLMLLRDDDDGVGGLLLMATVAMV